MHANSTGVAEPAPLAPLHAYRQFIVVKLVPLPNGKTDKLPMNPYSGTVTEKGSDGAHNPLIWLSHDEALALATSWGPQFTVGFVLTEADPFWCLDIDGARGPDGGWSSLATTLCNSLPGTAVEVSQSGQGLHIWGQGVVPPHAAKNVPLHIELYTERRFIALGTGAVGDMTRPCPAIAQIAAAYFPPRAAVALAGAQDGPRADWAGPTDDDELLRRAMRSQSAGAAFEGKATFADLWNADVGVLSRNYPADANSKEPFDRSSADAALFQHLAFWTGCDRARMLTLAQRSALVREKWDREDYIGRTIENACAMCRSVLQDKARSGLTVEQITERLWNLRLKAGDTEKGRAEVLGDWVELAAPLAPDATDAVITCVEQCTGVGRLALKQSLRQARAKIEAERRLQRIEQQAAGRVLLPLTPGDLTKMAVQIEAAIMDRAKPGDYVSFAGKPCKVAERALPFTHSADDDQGKPPPVPQLVALDETAMLGLIEGACVLTTQQAGKAPRTEAVPDRLVKVMLNRSDLAAPRVNGLVAHPLVDPVTGEILAAEGLHERTGLFVRGAGSLALRAYSQGEASEAVARLRGAVLDGFEFAAESDADIALAGLFTGVQRRALDQAPGLAVLANVQSSGKTTLTRRIHVVLTGRDLPVTTFPPSEEEAAKVLLSLLLQSPAMVCFDNVPDGFTFQSGVLAAAMTAATYEARQLGGNSFRTVPTNVLFAMTGNNLSFGNDEVSRWLACRLMPKVSRPHERTFRHSDVVRHGLAIRGQVLADVVGIVAGFRVANSSAAASASRFPEWDKTVRQPLLWAGASDVAQVFRANADASETVRAHASLLWALSQLFGTRPFTAQDVTGTGVFADPTGGPGREAREALRLALEQLGARPESARSVGKKLAAGVGRVAEVLGREIKLAAGIDPHSKVNRFSLVPV